ncbi:MAG: hypothetical protein DWH97_09810 [Planctomycetota bacterium]|nr:MAG: hypothetical protein DWH97_09810 [Planctomycetota bacterium]
MARIHEHQGKQLLAAVGIKVPRGGVAHSAEQASAVATSLGGEVVVKIQAWTTGRKAMGGVAFANSPADVARETERMLVMRVGNFPVESVLVEEKLKFVRELFVSLSIDDRARAPVILLASAGGSGIEERAHEVARIPCSVSSGPNDAALASAVMSLELSAAQSKNVIVAINTVFALAKARDARSIEINPLVILADDSVVAADCRITIDDYAVWRHADLGIEIAREFDHPPTALERIAYDIEQADHRGTFYFAQLAVERAAGTRGLAGFHGAGGGGSMMSMDALTAENFTVANFTDTSGNPSAAKVYRASRVILSQPGLIGYFGSGSGVANQEQFWSAYGLAKAFWELDIDIPVVIRLGGNGEERAVAILHDAARDLRAVVEGYLKTDSPAKIARRFGELCDSADACWTPRAPRRPSYVGDANAISFPITGGRVWIDGAQWKSNGAKIVAQSSGLLRDDQSAPALAVDADKFASKDSELIACEVECRMLGLDGFFVELDVMGLDAAIETRCVAGGIA